MGGRFCPLLFKNCVREEKGSKEDCCAKVGIYRRNYKRLNCENESANLATCFFPADVEIISDYSSAAYRLSIVDYLLSYHGVPGDITWRPYQPHVYCTVTPSAAFLR